MSASKQRGTETERMVVNYLQLTWPDVERRAMQGRYDMGDVINVPYTCLEIKGDRTNRIDTWKAETVTEAVNAKADFMGLIVRVERKPVKNWDIWMPLDQLGIPLYGEDAWVRMPLATGVEVLKHLIGMHRASLSPPSSGHTVWKLNQS